MANEAAIQTLIDAIGTGELNTALEVRTALEGLLGESYPTIAEEDSSATHANTVPNSNFSYDVLMTKQGRTVLVTGSFTSNTTISAPSSILIFTVDGAEYLSSGDAWNIGMNISNGNTLPLQLTSNQLTAKGTITTGETYYFSLTYNVAS